MAGAVKGTFDPEKPLSLQHWLDSAATAMMIMPGMRFLNSAVERSLQSRIASQEIRGSLPEGIGAMRHDPNVDMEAYTVGTYEELSKRATGALDDGFGTYASQGGHHPMAKSAFEGVSGYDYKSALTISQSKLTEFGVKHSTITGQQKMLYSAFNKTGESLTMETMKQIEIKAMTNSGVPLDYAKNAVEKAITALVESGVTQPSRIPWGK